MLFLARAGAAEMLGNRGDVKLVDRGLLLARLRAPVGRRAAEQRSLRMRLREFPRRAIEEQIFGELALVLGNRREALDALGVHDREIEPRLRAVIQENGVDHFARAGRQSERHVGNSQHGAHVRDLLLDQANAFDRFDRAADIIFVARSAGKNERIENDIFRADAVFFGEQIVASARRFQVCVRA